MSCTVIASQLSNTDQSEEVSPQIHLTNELPGVNCRDDNELGWVDFEISTAVFLHKLNRFDMDPFTGHDKFSCISANLISNLQTQTTLLDMSCVSKAQSNHSSSFTSHSCLSFVIPWFSALRNNADVTQTADDLACCEALARKHRKDFLLLIMGLVARLNEAMSEASSTRKDLPITPRWNMHVLGLRF